MTEVKDIKLTEEEIERCNIFITAFYKAYRFATGNKLESVEQILELIRSGKFTFDDVYMTYLESSLKGCSEEVDIFWEDNMEMFDCVNYFPQHKRLADGGSWIKIRTENGFEVHWAKVSNRKRRLNEELELVESNFNRAMSEGMKLLENNTLPSEKLKAKQEKLHKAYYESLIRALLDIKPYEVRIQRSKSKVEYYLPYQYEIVDNIEEFSNAYIEEVPGVDAKAIYTSQNSEIVFYLQSRGISKRVAEIMAVFKQTYFKVNMKEAMDAYNEQWTAQLKAAGF